jgi:predicted nucleic acid-binding protein
VKILLDTSVLIDALRDRAQRRQFLASLAQMHHTLATSVLNVAEVYAGMRPQEHTQTEALFAGLICFGLTESAARLGGQFKNTWSQRGHTLSLIDALIAAIAIEENCALLTDNKKHFPMKELHLYPLP